MVVPCTATTSSIYQHLKLSVYVCVCIIYIAFHLIVTHPTNTSAAAPFSALFKCSIQAYGYLTITWYRNNTYPVPQKAYSTLIPSANVTTSILTIPNVTRGDIGTYYCVATVGRITLKSQSANLFLAGIYNVFAV